MSLCESSNKTVGNKITGYIIKNKLGHKSYLFKDKEAYIVEETEIEGAQGLLRHTAIIYNEIQQVLHVVVFRDYQKPIKPCSALRYAHRVIARVNKEEENS